MFYVYLLRSTKNRKYYTGFAQDLVSRFSKHNKGLVNSTRGGRPWELIYYEAYSSKKDALMRENRLKKSQQARTAMRGRLVHSIKIGG